MRSQEFELLVRQRVNALRAGHHVEDDGLEVKRIWPDPKAKARQLAASANRQAGGPLIYIIGVDERTGEVKDPGEIEAGEWFAQAAKAFDDRVVPRLVRHQQVAVGEDEYVTGLLFATDEYPYVVRAGDGGREIPMRSGAHTRSAYRHELLDLLKPTLDLPKMTITGARVKVQQLVKDTQAGDATLLHRMASVTVEMWAAVFVEYVGDGAAVLPEAEMHARIRSGDFEAHLEPKLNSGGGTVLLPRSIREPAPEPPPPPRFGVYVRDAQVVATAPGSFRIRSRQQSTREFSDETSHPLVEIYDALDDMELDLALFVAGARSPAHLTSSLARSEARQEAKVQVIGDLVKSTQELGSWEIPVTFFDPWAQG